MNAFGNWTDSDVLLHNQRVIERKMRRMGFKPTQPSATFDKGMLGPGPDLESDLHDSILEYCRSRGWLPIHSRMDKKTTTALGVSDFIIVTPKTVLFVEAKRKGNKPTPKQRGFLAAVGALGWPSAVVYSMDEFEEFMMKIVVAHST